MAVIAILLFLVPIAANAYVNGADPLMSGAPGDSVCSSCHGGGGGPAARGNVIISTSGGEFYVPGVKQKITVLVTDTTARRFGFQISARQAKNPSAAQAGSFNSIDGNTQSICQDRRPVPCTTAAQFQFVTHTLAGTIGTGKFEFEWTPPPTDTGAVVFYAAGNGANGDGTDRGDHIYTTSLLIASNKPQINPTRGVVNGASFLPGIASNSWITITGINLASTTRVWTAAELGGGKLPTSLDGVGVSVNNKPAYVYFISPTQINAIAPSDTAVGPVDVTVTSNNSTSDFAIANLQTFSPALFTFDGTYAAAAHANNALLGKAGLFPSAPTATTPAKPGEVIVLYGSGFGPTEPQIPAGQLTDKVALIKSDLSLTIGNLSAKILFAGLVPPFAQLYQINVEVPASLAAGDHAVVARIGGQTSAAAVKITVAP